MAAGTAEREVSIEEAGVVGTIICEETPLVPTVTRRAEPRTGRRIYEEVLGVSVCGRTAASEMAGEIRKGKQDGSRPERLPSRLFRSASPIFFVSLQLGRLWLARSRPKRSPELRVSPQLALERTAGPTVCLRLIAASKLRSTLFRSVAPRRSGALATPVRFMWLHNSSSSCLSQARTGSFPAVRAARRSSRTSQTWTSS